MIHSIRYKPILTYHQCDYIDGLAQDCSNSSALAMELLQSCTKSSTWTIMLGMEKMQRISIANFANDSIHQNGDTFMDATSSQPF